MDNKKSISTLPYVKCVTCGKLIGNLYIEYINKLIIGNKSDEEIFDELKIERICCRMNIKNPPVIPISINYKLEHEINKELDEERLKLMDHNISSDEYPNIFCEKCNESLGVEYFKYISLFNSIKKSSEINISKLSPKETIEHLKIKKECCKKSIMDDKISTDKKCCEYSLKESRNIKFICYTYEEIFDILKIKKECCKEALKNPSKNCSLRVPNNTSLPYIPERPKGMMNLTDSQRNELLIRKQTVFRVPDITPNIDYS